MVGLLVNLVGILAFQSSLSHGHSHGGLSHGHSHGGQSHSQSHGHSHAAGSAHGQSHSCGSSHGHSHGDSGRVSPQGHGSGPAHAPVHHNTNMEGAYIQIFLSWWGEGDEFFSSIFDYSGWGFFHQMFKSHSVVPAWELSDFL